MNYMKHNLRTKRIAMLLLVVFINFLTACCTWRVIPVENVSSETNKISLSGNFVILHKQDSSEWHLRNATIFKNRNTLYGTLEKLGELEKDNNTTYLHVYITDNVQIDNLEVQIPLGSIHKMEYEEMRADAGKSLLAIVGITGGIMFILWLIWQSTSWGNLSGI